MRNNNKEVLQLLARKSYRDNRSRNRILTGAAAFAVIMLFGVFSLAVGKIETDYLLYVRNSGTAAYTLLERPTEEQCQVIQNLSYIKGIGKTVYIGRTDQYDCEVLDEDAYENMQKPAYTDINGVYPAHENEIMLPMRALEAMGVERPEVGMDITAGIQLADGQTMEKTFRLSAYYTEYADPFMTVPRGFFSQEFLDTLHIDTARNTTLLIRQNDTIVDDYVENLLYRDVPMRDDTQQFLGGNAVTRQVIYDIAGGFDTAAALALLILFGAFLLLYNVLQISFNRDIRQYGLLKTLGTTKRQMRSIVYRQVLRTVLFGCLIGSVLGVVLIISVVPKLLSGMYLRGVGDTSAMIAFKPWILFGANIFGASVTMLSAAFAMKKVVKMSPVEAVNYREHAASDGKKERKTTGGGAISHMAWRNILRFRKRLIITVFSLFLGITVSLGAVVISKGTDTTNQINYENSDFQIGSHMSAMQVEEYSDEDIFFGPELRDEIMGLGGIAGSEVVRGGFGRISGSEEALAVRFEADEFDMEALGEAPANICMVVQALSDTYLDELDRLVKEKGLYIDMNAVKRGEGLILMHNHSLSQILTERSRATVGMPMDIYNLNQEKTGSMVLGGYLDFKEKGLPRFQRTWNGPGIIYFITGEKGFANTGLPDRTFGMSFDVEPETEPRTKVILNNLIQAHNRRVETRAAEEGEQVMNEALYMTAKSDMLESARSYIVSSRIIMGVLCIILITMGLVNYVNVTMTGLAMRKKEFAVLESIGLTRKQLRYMLFMEGGFYSAAVTAAVMALGSGALYGLKHLMKKRIAYFVFTYPAAELAVCIAALFIVCIAVPLVMYKKTVNESVIERLRNYTD